MTFISLAQARRQLDVDPKTLRRWLAQAQLAVLSHSSDHRLKGISEPQLRELAHQHHRQLTSLAPEAPPALEATALPDPSALLDLLHELHEQIAVLQQQVSVLSAQLQPSPAPTSPAPPVAAPAPAPAPKARKKPAPKAKPKRVAVIPRVEVGSDGKYVVICPKQGLLPFEPDSQAWFVWVKEQESFRFVGKGGSFTAHHEQGRVPRGAWRAHRHIRNRSYTLRLAPNHQLTLAVLEEAAAQLQAHLN